MNKADPRIFLIAYLLFFAAGSRVLSEAAAIVVVAGGIAFAAGVELSGKLRLEERKINIRQGALQVLFVISAVAVLLDLTRVGGLPLLNPALLPKHKTAYITIGLLAVPLAALMLANSRKKEWKNAIFPAAAVLLTIMIGYRTNIIASLLAFSIIAYGKGAIDRKKLAALLGVGLLLLLGASWLKVIAAGSGANPFEALFYRAEGTAAIFNRIAETTPPTGEAHGQIIASAFTSMTGIGGPQKGPRTLMAETFGARESITFTTSLLGEPYLDFGIAGVAALMLALGLILGWLSRTHEPFGTAAYAVLLAYALVEIETGILDLILFYYIAAGAYLLASARRTSAKTR